MSARIKDKSMKQVLPKLRKQLVERFPDFILSIRGEYLSYKVAFMQGPFKFDFPTEYSQHYSYKLVTIFNVMDFPLEEQNLFNAAFEIAKAHNIPPNKFVLTVGRLDKPYSYVKGKVQ